MRKILLLGILFFPMLVLSQQRFTISGFVEDADTHERLIGANIITRTKQGVASNKYGFYSLTLPAAQYEITGRYVGFEPVTIHIDLKKDTTLDFLLRTGLELDEVEVKAKMNSKTNPQLSALSFVDLNMKQIDKAPVVFGERDVLKTIQFMPGIKSGRENTAGFNVRGGSSDQNLILLDGVPVYNVNHLFGFFSVFNNDAIKNVSLYKSGIPARYGGRLSSVLDISMKEGDLKQYHGVFSVSPISARITMEGPIKKDTAAFIVSLRRTMLDIPMLLYQNIIGQENKFGYYFYDFNAKANWIVNPNNRVYFSVYAGQDKQFNNSNYDGAKSKFRYNWGNLTTVFRWNKTLSSRLFSNISAYYSQYRLNNLGQSVIDGSKVVFRSNSDLQEYSLNADYDFYLNPGNTLRFGGKVSRMQFAPDIIQMIDNDNETTLNKDQKNGSNNIELFVENNMVLGRLILNYGLRGATYNTGEKTYWSLQPRAALKYNFSNTFSASAAFTEMAQFIHLLSNSSLGMPADLWVASTDGVGPQKSSQVSAGFEKDLNSYLLGVEGYYKRMRDVISWEEGAVFLDGQNVRWDKNIVVGKGEAYGVELFTKKTQGKFTGTLSYTLAWSNRQFDEVNNGKWFPHKYDRRHDISFLGEYQLLNTKSRDRSFSMGFTLQSGNNISMPDVEFEGMYLPGMENATLFKPEWPKARQSYANPNNFKMPLYHHLDFGYNSTYRRKDGKSYTWYFSVYNVYNRKNPWYYYKTEKGEVRQVSMFPIVPSVGFKYTF